MKPSLWQGRNSGDEGAFRATVPLIFMDVCMCVCYFGNTRSRRFTEVIMHFMVTKCSEPSSCQFWYVSMAMIWCVYVPERESVSLFSAIHIKFPLRFYSLLWIPIIVWSIALAIIWAWSGICAINVYVIFKECSHCQ